MKTKLWGGSADNEQNKCMYIVHKNIFASSSTWGKYEGHEVLPKNGFMNIYKFILLVLKLYQTIYLRR